MDPTVRALSLYLDTSVIGGYFDPEFRADTRALWRLMEAGRFRFVSSELVVEELARAPAVNKLHGYPPVRIVSPTFLIHGHEKEIV